MQWTGTILTTLKEDQPKIIPVKFDRNPISGLGCLPLCCFKIVNGRTDGQTDDDDDDDDGRWVSTIAHLELSAQVTKNETRVFSLIWPGDVGFDPKWPSFEPRNHQRKNILSKINDNYLNKIT